MKLFMSQFYMADTKRPLKRPWYDSLLNAVLDPADPDAIKKGMDLNVRLVRHENETYYVRASDDSLEPLGVKRGDLMIVDRAAEPRPHHIVVVLNQDDMYLKRVRTDMSLEPLDLEGMRRHAKKDDDEHEEVWGVITHSIRELI